MTTTLASPQVPPAVAPSAPVIEDAELIIRPRKGWIAIDWRELFRYRELLFFLIWRDVKVKYKQAILGFAWAVLVPVISMMIFTTIGRFAGFTAGIKAPYRLYIFAGLIPWLFLQSGITNGGLSLVNQQNLLSKIYLPRLFIPTATVGGALFDMLIYMIVFAALLLISRFAPSHNIIFLPALILLAAACSLGMAYLLSALTINYRDVRFLIPFLSQILMWISAVVIPPEKILGANERWLALDPIYGIVSAFRWSILGERLHTLALLAAIVESVTLLIVGLFYFRKAERRFADIA